MDEVYEVVHQDQEHLAPLAVAARRLGRPVKLVPPPAHARHPAGPRPACRHRVRLGADRSGRLLAAIHEADQQASRYDPRPVTYTELTSRLYDIRNFRVRRRHIRTGPRPPGHLPTRFEHSTRFFADPPPSEHPAAFALESAIDEIACRAGRDPVELRLANAARVNPVTGEPLSSRPLAACLRRGAELFGWAARTPDPGSMHADDGTPIGWGVAAGAYGFVAHFAEVRVEPMGRVRVTRVVSVAARDRTADPVTAEAQVRDAVTWGIGAAVIDHDGINHDSLDLDGIDGDSIHADLIHAGLIQVDLIDLDLVDRSGRALNPMGARPFGEVTPAGVAPAIANAVFHATGHRPRRLPIRTEDLL
ncbi:molybdopterin cofactor-binding domain-containing protein [Nonomuraea antimicrobica]